ncbi:DUF6372 family protein [Streptomyces sp. NPDC006632]|uniref:DUF6372 family protein n=1 Tax=Streptomyces sp. NPDC006632 TaxID=3157182 RepID=UPI0033A3958E
MTDFDTESLPPILTIQLDSMSTWEQSDPAGCRCVCAVLHRSDAFTYSPEQSRVACTNTAQPGMLIRIETPADTSVPLPVCIGCYHQLAP